jgi:hypothetical protein
MTPPLTPRQYIGIEVLKVLIAQNEYVHLYDAAADADRYALALLAVWDGKTEEAYLDEATATEAE